MRDLEKQERTAMDAVAKYLSAKWETSSDLHDADITLAGKRVAVDVVTLKRHGTDPGDAAKPRLRFDKVATRLMEHLQATLAATVPDGMTVLLTITAPIRLPSKTAASLEDKIQTLLARGSPDGDEIHTIHGNCVRIRILKVPSERTQRIIGFIHNPDSDPLVFLNMTSELLALSNANDGRWAHRSADDRWLVATSTRASSCLETYRYIYSQLLEPTGFETILIVFSDGRVGMLTEAVLQS